jgi:hypothetical protein
VDQLDAGLGERGLLPKRGRGRGRVLEVDLLALLDDGIHDERAPATLHLAAQEIEQRLPMRAVDRGRLDRKTARRLLVQDGEIEIAVERHGVAPRNRRRREDEEMRAPPGVRAPRERDPLPHAEAVLLVDGDERERAEGDLGLEERVRPDRDGDLPRCETFQDGPPLPLRRRRGEKPPGDAGRFELLRCGRRVLLREEHRGGEERSLMPRACGAHGTREREHGLAGADVAQEEPPHRHLAVEVLRHRGERLRLRARERKGKGREVAPHRGVARPKRRRAMRLPVAAPHELERHLEREDLLEGEALPRRLPLRDILREVNPLERDRQRG